MSSLFLITGNLSLRLRKGFGISALGSARRAQSRRISLHFPCRSGKRQQRRVRSRLPPPPSSLRARRLLARTPTQPENIRDSAGSWASGPRGSEPETAGSEPVRPCGLYLSLLPSRAVRFRRRSFGLRVQGIFARRAIRRQSSRDSEGFCASGSSAEPETPDGRPRERRSCRSSSLSIGSVPQGSASCGGSATQDFVWGSRS